MGNCRHGEGVWSKEFQSSIEGKFCRIRMSADGCSTVMRALLSSREKDRLRRASGESHEMADICQNQQRKLEKWGEGFERLTLMRFPTNGYERDMGIVAFCGL